MMLSEGNRPNPTVQVPPWSLYDDPTTGILYSQTLSHSQPQPVSGISSTPNDYAPYLLSEAAMSALQRYLPCNESMMSELDSGESDSAVDEYSCDEFRMYDFKVRRCARGRSHDWTECPFAHPGEKARRRDPRKYHYSGTACPDFRKGTCKRGDSCEYAHGVFECWLHPARYRTQPCKDGTACRRRVCFFAHTPEQLRVLPLHSPRASVSAASSAPDSYDGSPLRHHSFPKSSLVISPTSTLISPPLSPTSDSPPLSPNGVSIRRSAMSNSVNEVLAFSLRQLQLSKVKSAPSSWGLQLGSPGSLNSLNLRPVFSSLPSTPTTPVTPSTAGMGWMEIWDKGCLDEEEPMARVESGRDLRAKVFEKLSKENSVEMAEAAATAPDVGWVSELVM